MLRHLIYVLLLLTSFNAYTVTKCELSEAALYRANELANQAKPIAEQQAMLQEAIDLCPDNAYAHNNLANLFGKQKQFNQAIQHYKLALKHQADLSEAYYGLGQAYYELQQYPLSLQAFLNICRQDEDAKKHIKTLLRKDRYKIPQQGQIFNTASLTLLYERIASEQLQQQLTNCGYRVTVQNIRKAAFKNLVDKTSQLSPQAEQQLAYLIGIIENLQAHRVEIASTDKSYKTALNELAQLMRKLGLSNKIELITKLDSVPESMQNELAAQVRITLE